MSGYNVHPMPTHFPSADAAAQDYEDTLRTLTRWVVAVETPADPPLRLTLTLPALIRAANTYVRVTGAKKARALHHVLTGVPDPNSYPAAGVRLTEGR